MNWVRQTSSPFHLFRTKTWNYLLIIPDCINRTLLCWWKWYEVWFWMLPSIPAHCEHCTYILLRRETPCPFCERKNFSLNKLWQACQISLSYSQSELLCSSFDLLQRTEVTAQRSGWASKHYRSQKEAGRLGLGSACCVSGPTDDASPTHCINSNIVVNFVLD